jgi:hypothetical protein
MNGRMALLALYMLSSSAIVMAGRILGGDLDEWGCKASAGYSWCEESQSCERWANCLSKQ